MGYPMAERLVKARPHGARLEPHAGEGRAAGRQGRRDRRQARPISPMSISSSPWSRPGRDLERGLFRRRRRDQRRRRRCRASWSIAPRSASTTSEAIRGRDRRPRRAVPLPRRSRGNGKMRQGRQAVMRRLRAGERLRRGEALSRHDRAAAASPMSAKASSRASARSPTTSCSAW